MRHKAQRTFLLLLASCFLLLASFSQEPLRLSTETEDIFLTDDINIARAQVAKYPENAEAHFNLAIALSRTSKVEEAIKELRKTKILIRKPENAGIIEKKINEYNEMLKNNPEAHNIRYRLAFSHYLKAYFMAKEIQKKKNQNIKKTSSSILDSQSLLIKKQNPIVKDNLDKSVSYFQEHITLNPDDSWAKVYYAFILVEQYGDIIQAKKIWSSVLEKEPNNPAPYFFLGELHIKEGDLKKGIQEISQAILLRSLGY